MRYVDQRDTLPTTRKRGNKLDETTNILDLYMHCTGKNEVPPQWHLWTCLSVIAAAVGNRVFYQKFAWEKLYPNMYIFLIGPSGAGKGQAIGFAMQLRHEAMNIFYGTATYKGLQDRFATDRGNDNLPNYNITWVVHPELADAVGSGPLADSLIKAMTNWYNFSDVEFEEHTRMHGVKMYKPPVLNWLAGTTEEWLQECVTRSAMDSGFFGRVVGVPGEYDWENRVYNPMDHQPKDYQEIMTYLCQRIDALTRIPEGSEFMMTPAAKQADEDWYIGRPVPNGVLLPFFRREHDLCLKLSMLLSLCRAQTLSIEVEDISRAQDLVGFVRKGMPKVVQQATGSKLARGVASVQQILYKNRTWIKRSHLLRKIQRWQLHAGDLTVILGELQQLDTVESRVRGNATYYRFKDPRKIDFDNIDPPLLDYSDN